MHPLDIFLICIGILDLILFTASLINDDIDVWAILYLIAGLICIFVGILPSEPKEATDEQYITIQSLAKSEERIRPVIKVALEDGTLTRIEYKSIIDSVASYDSRDRTKNILEFCADKETEDGTE